MSVKIELEELLESIDSLRDSVSVTLLEAEQEKSFKQVSIGLVRTQFEAHILNNNIVEEIKTKDGYYKPKKIHELWKFWITGLRTNNYIEGMEEIIQ